MIRDAFLWIVAQHVLAHCLLALALMGLLCGLLRWLRVDGFAWHAAAYVSLFYYAREAAQAERALKPMLGDPMAFFWTLWPGNWSAGGARLWEWLAPALVVMLVAALSPRSPLPRATRELDLARPRREPRSPE